MSETCKHRHLHGGLGKANRLISLREVPVPGRPLYHLESEQIAVEGDGCFEVRRGDGDMVKADDHGVRLPVCYGRTS